MTGRRVLIAAEHATVTIRAMRTNGARWSGALVAVLALAACSDDGGGDPGGAATSATGASPSPTTLPASAPTADPAPSTTSAVTTTTGPSAPTTEEEDTDGTNPVVTATAPSGTGAVTPPTGVPGIDDDDPFCAAWARTTATGQLLRIAAGFGGLDSLGLARLEVLASPNLLSSGVELAGSIPEGLEIEGQLYLEGVLGPPGRRAERAVQLLTDAGATDAQLDELVAAWAEVLRTRDPALAVPELPTFDAELETRIGAAAAALDEQVTPYGQDPSLDTSANAVPEIDAYVAERCADLTDLGVGDAV